MALPDLGIAVLGFLAYRLLRLGVATVTLNRPRRRDRGALHTLGIAIVISGLALAACSALAVLLTLAV